MVFSTVHRELSCAKRAFSMCVCVCVMTIMMCTYIFAMGEKGVVAWNRVRSVFVRINEKLNVDACALCAAIAIHTLVYI